MTRRKPIILAPKRTQTCGKNRYSSRQEADRVAGEQELIFAADNLKLKSYRCAGCGGWHLTRLRPQI